VARQNPSESRLAMAVGGSTETRHWPSEHALDTPPRQPECTLLAYINISLVYISIFITTHTDNKCFHVNQGSSNSAEIQSYTKLLWT